MSRRRTGEEGSMFPMPNEYVPANSNGAVGEPQQQKQSSKTVSFPMPSEYVSADGRVGRRGVPRLRSRIQTFVYRNGQWMKFGAPQYMTTEQARQNIEQAVQGGFTDPIGYGKPGPMPEWVLSRGRWLTAAEAMRAAAVPRLRTRETGYIQFFVWNNTQWSKYTINQMTEAQARQDVEQAIQANSQWTDRIGYVVSGPQGAPTSAPQWVYFRGSWRRYADVQGYYTGAASAMTPAPPPAEAAPAPAPPPGPSWQPPPVSINPHDWLVFVKEALQPHWYRAGEVIRDVPFDKAKNTLFEQKRLRYTTLYNESRCYAVAELPPPAGPGEPAREEPSSPTVFIGCGPRVRLPR